MRFRVTRIVLAVASVLVVALVAIFFVVRGGRGPLVDEVSQHFAERDVSSAFHKRRLNFLVVGAQPDEGTSDTIILAHLDLDRRLATLISIPRDTWVAIPRHGHQKINAAYGIGGPALTARLVGAMLGTHVDSTLAIDPTGAKQVVDAIGGINIDVDHAMDYDDNFGDLHIHLKAGEQFLNGGQVLEYMRFRHDIESDWGRMRRQQQVVHEIVKELGEPQNWAKIPRLVALARKDVRTPLDDAQLKALVELYRGVPPDNVRTLTLPGRADFVGDASVVLVDDGWAKILGALVCGPGDPPQNVVLVANGTGIPSVTKLVVGAMRGGAWNVETSVDEPTHATSQIVGRDAAARRLSKIFASFPRRSGKATVVRLGVDARPSV